MQVCCMWIQYTDACRSPNGMAILCRRSLARTETFCNTWGKGRKWLSDSRVSAKPQAWVQPSFAAQEQTACFIAPCLSTITRKRGIRGFGGRRGVNLRCAAVRSQHTAGGKEDFEPEDKDCGSSASRASKCCFIGPASAPRLKHFL